MTKILLDVMYEDLEALLGDLGRNVETVTKHLGVTQQDRDDGVILRYARENGMVVVTADKKFIERLKVSGVSVITIDAVDKARVVHEKVGNGSTRV